MFPVSCCCAQPPIPGPPGPQGIPGPPGEAGPPGPEIGITASLSNRTGQTFTAPNYGSVAFSQVNEVNGMDVRSNNQYLVVLTPGLYLINYGLRATTGVPGLVAITFMPYGFDDASRIPLTANSMVSGSIVRRLGAQTVISLNVESTDNNTPVTIPASTGYANAYLTVVRVGPYPS